MLSAHNIQRSSAEAAYSGTRLWPIMPIATADLARFPIDLS